MRQSCRPSNRQQCLLGHLTECRAQRFVVLGSSPEAQQMGGEIWRRVEPLVQEKALLWFPGNRCKMPALRANVASRMPKALRTWHHPKQSPDCCFPSRARKGRQSVVGFGCCQNRERLLSASATVAPGNRHQPSPSAQVRVRPDCVDVAEAIPSPCADASRSRTGPHLGPPPERVFVSRRGGCRPRDRQGQSAEHSFPPLRVQALPA